MKIAGFQPLSLIDFPEKSCTIVFTQGCPFRCPFCHNPELIPTKSEYSVSEEEVLAHLTKHKVMLDGVTITGGEPTLQPDLEDFIRKIKDLGFAVKLDSNGIHPEKLQRILDQNLVDYIAMDLKNTWEDYQLVIRAGGENTVSNCQKSFKIIQDSGVDHEFRTTIYPGVHTEKDFETMVGYLKPGEKYFVQVTQFKKNLDDNMSQNYNFVPEDLVQKLKEKYPDVIIDIR
ncbi:MAG: anaerobic ribonucleoside-triphosphate reductase activating protein [Patescibacteria group bacterium]